MAKIVVGMSGGVDSSTVAAMLKEQGHEVIGLFMRNWKETDDSGCCTAEQDFQDVKDVCNKIGIPYYSVDFSQEYYDRVFRLFVEEYSAGRTPNPDVLCNKEIKFDAFLKYALMTGADYVATGHYCKVEHVGGKSYLLRAEDDNKCQAYFLNQLTGQQLDKVMFPIGDIDKPMVRQLAERYGLTTATKKDSTGICFIGERNFRKFLSQYIPMQDGDIMTMDGTVVGRHNGVYYYTIGQRKGLGIGGLAGGNGDKWFVLSKDVAANILYVSQGEDDVLYHSKLVTGVFNWIPDAPSEEIFDCQVRIRHRQTLQDAVCHRLSGGSVEIIFKNKQRAITTGQYAVVYCGKYCLGGGVIERYDD